MEQEPQSSGPPVLAYGVDKRPWHRRRWFRRLLICTVISLIAFFAFRAVWSLTKAYRDQALHLQKQYRLSRQLLPDGTIIFTEDPAKIATLQGNPAYQSKRAVWGQAYGPASLPDAWERKEVNDSFEATDYSSTTIDKYQIGDTFSFRRISPGGKEWIVNLSQVNPFAASQDRRKVGICQGSFSLVGWAPGSRGISRSYVSRKILLQPSDIITVFAPRPSATSTAEVILPYEINSQPGTLIGTVQDDGYVLFKLGSGPAKVVKGNEP